MFFVFYKKFEVFHSEASHKHIDKIYITDLH